MIWHHCAKSLQTARHGKFMSAVRATATVEKRKHCKI